MKLLDVKYVPLDKLREHRRFILRDNESEKANYAIIDEPITKELCIRLYRGVKVDEQGHKYGTRQYSISPRAMEHMLDTLTNPYSH